MTRSKYFFCCLLFLSLSFESKAQIKDKAPKVGLVLSGGGARGMAHIGILKALEKAGIYPDIITGTSMGSVVGGLYALGYSADEIEKIAVEADWGDLLSNLVPFKEVAIEEKPYYWRYIFELPVRGFTPELPSGVIEGENLYKLFSQLTRSAHGISNFDDLPIPFRCVATDIVTGERVVMSSGSLAESIRASMAIPTVFTPVEIGDHLLVDGGLVRNFPVDEALEMGADIIIGVSVSEDLVPREKLNTMADILIQSSWMMGAFDSREQIKKAHVFIEPDLEDFGTADFNKSAAIIGQGEKMGNEFLPQFQSLADSLKANGKIFNKPEKINEIEDYAIREIIVKGNRKIPTDFITGKLRIAPFEQLNVTDINERLREVYGTQYFAKIDYEIIKAEEGFDLLVKVKEKPQVYLKTALYYNNETRAGLNVNLTARNKIWPNSRMLAEIDFSENFRTEFSFLKYLGQKQNAAVTLGYQSLDSDIPFYSEGEEIAVFDDYDHNFYFVLQTTKRSTSSTGLRFDGNIHRLKPEILSASLSDLDKIKEESISASAFWTVNTLNDPIIPSAGLNFNLSFGYNFNNSLRQESIGENPLLPATFDSLISVTPHAELSMSLKYFLPLSKKWSLFTDNQLKYIATNQTSLDTRTGLGGFFVNHPNTTPFWGASFYQFQQFSFALVRLGIQYEPVNNLYFMAGINYANSEYPKAWFDEDFVANTFDNDNHIWGAGAQLMYNSAFGPIGVALGRLIGNNQWVPGINIGFWY